MTRVFCRKQTMSMLMVCCWCGAEDLIKGYECRCGSFFCPSCVENDSVERCYHSGFFDPYDICHLVCFRCKKYCVDCGVSMYRGCTQYCVVCEEHRCQSCMKKNHPMNSQVCFQNVLLCKNS